MLSHQASTIITIVFYAVSTLIGLWGMLSRKSSWQKTGCWLAVAGFIFQTFTLVLGFHKSFPGGLSSGAYLQMLAWFVGLSGLGIWLKFKQYTAITFATPFCLALFAMSLPYMEQIIVLPAAVQSSFYALHIGALFISLALLSVSFIVSAIFLILERRIKRKQGVKGFLNDLPALSLLDKLNGFGIITSFPLYTIGLLVGLMRAKPVYGAAFTGDPKEIVSIIIWLLLAVIFHNRLARSWTGKKPAQMMIGIFLLSIFSLLVVNTLMPSHHAFIRP